MEGIKEIERGKNKKQNKIVAVNHRLRDSLKKIITSILLYFFYMKTTVNNLIFLSLESFRLFKNVEKIFEKKNNNNNSYVLQNLVFHSKQSNVPFTQFKMTEPEH